MISALKKGNNYGLAYWLSIGILFAFIIIGNLLSVEYIIVIPFVILAAIFCILNPRLCYYALFFSIPISLELYFGPVGTDFPSELLMICSSGFVLIYMLTNADKAHGEFFIHPFTICLFFIVSWMAFTSLWANNFIISLKFIVAKAWYILPFYIGPMVFCRSIHQIKRLLLILAIPLTISVLVAIVRHSFVDFDYAETNFILGPSFRNHVIYAAVIVIFLPFMLFIGSVAKSKHVIWIYLVGLILVIGLYFSYTRAAYLSFIGIIGMYFIVKMKMVRPFLALGILAPLLFLFIQLPNNAYLEFAPDYHKTISHYNFEDLVSATTRGEDVSSMERVHRWVAAYHMFKERPVLGFGPGNFYTSYKPYALNMFRTYVSDNEDGSGIHSYYLMTLVEQGIVGLFLYILLLILFYSKAQEVYHREKDPRIKALIMSCILSFTAIAIMQLLNDLIETDKTGPFFFFCLSIVVLCDLKMIQAEPKADHLI